MNSILQHIGQRLARYLGAQRPEIFTPISGGKERAWQSVVMPADVLLVEGRSRLSTAVKYLSQSTWSHAALIAPAAQGGMELIEADVERGVVASPFERYANYNVRICRPVGLLPDERDRVVGYARARIGLAYDLKNVVDLARYLWPTPPMFPRYRRRLLTLGSGEPTKKLICSSLIAQAFQEVRYPILPVQWWDSDDTNERVLVSQIRHHSLFVPRDFDLSPYFAVIKPTLVEAFDHRSMRWAEEFMGSGDS